MDSCNDARNGREERRKDTSGTTSGRNNYESKSWKARMELGVQGKRMRCLWWIGGDDDKDIVHVLRHWEILLPLVEMKRWFCQLEFNSVKKEENARQNKRVIDDLNIWQSPFTILHLYSHWRHQFITMGHRHPPVNWQTQPHICIFFYLEKLKRHFQFLHAPSPSLSPHYGLGSNTAP